MKKLIDVGPFKARESGDRIRIYPYKRDRFYAVTVFKPRMEISLRTGKMALTPGRVEWGHHRTTTPRQVLRYAMALIEAVSICNELNMEARGVPK